ncbi:MAG: hypothetical protein M0Z41_02290 [Peptococcaceae bacterium]|nr:hypothetical protein [Peptococcaceae bacterium]
MPGDRRGVTLIGHSLVPTGRGEDVRCVFRALQSIGTGVTVCDVPSGPSLDDDVIAREIADRLVTRPGGDFNTHSSSTASMSNGY